MLQSIDVNAGVKLAGYGIASSGGPSSGSPSPKPAPPPPAPKPVSPPGTYSLPAPSGGSASAPTSAGSVDIYTEEGQVIRGSRVIGALGADLFGDQVSLYTGALTFAQTDVSLPGSSALPVSVARSFRAGVPLSGTSGYGLFADWDLDIPHISGFFGLHAGWGASPDGATISYQRCSTTGAPPSLTGDGGGAAPGTFDADDYWHGTTIHMPGRGDDDLLDGGAPGADATAYPKTTRHYWRIGCTTIANSATTPAYQTGEGYVVTTPDGVSYRFDWLVSRSALSLVKPLGSSGGQSPIGSNYLLNRIESWMLPTQVTDAFGNWVTYTYDTAHPWHLTQIAASDGRTITLHYDNSTTPDFVSSVTTTDGASGKHTWTYAYGGATGPLSGITLPDNSKWSFSLVPLTNDLLSYVLPPSGPDYSCTTMNSVMSPGPFTGTMTHPSGASGSFSVQATRHARSYVAKNCIGGSPSNGFSQYPWNPEQWDAYSITNKTITGPGLGTLSWGYTYSAPAPSWTSDACATNNTCSTTKTVSVLDPENHTTTYTFGTHLNVDEGLLLSTAVDGLRTQTQTYHSSIAAPGHGQVQRGDVFTRSAPLPIDSRTITQQGQTFSWSASSFSTYAHPTHVTRSSDLGYSRGETIAFESKTTPWLLDLMDSTTEDSSGAVMDAHTFDPSTGAVLTHSSYGITTDTYTYNGDGTVYTHKDAGGHTTTYSNYSLGIAQNVSLPDGNAVSAVVDSLGRITSVTDATGYSTGYGYDAMSRLSSITPPSETSPALTYNKTSLTFASVNAAEYGLAAGHWKQTVTTGTGTEEHYFDALWRPVVTRVVDSNNSSATQRYTVKLFDSQGRATFAAYPVSSLTAYSDSLNGEFTSYDSLGRVTGTVANSEIGSLSTTTQYQAGFQTQFTDARNNSTTTSYQAFDGATTDAPVKITAPEGVTVTITRDLFGKPTAIKRSGTYSNAPISLTRSYVYDGNQRLCKTIEPESGATLQDYDGSNNIAWLAPGTTLTSTACDRSSVTAAKKITYGYDEMNRLTSTTYGDGNPGISEDYTADGLPNTLSSDGSKWTYTYNRHRLLTNESLAFNGGSYAIGYGIDANGHTKSVTYPDGTVVAYAPDALGEATQVGAYASALTYYPNGALNTFSYGNGVTHTTSQNTRGRPSESADTFGTTKVLDDVLSYDANANPTGIADSAGTGNSRTMVYDNLDRLTSATGPWGSGSYTYDPLDNLRTSSVGSRSYTHTYDSNNRLSALKTGTTTTVSYSYDTYGNLSSRSGQGFTFDQANRLRSVSGIASYHYDGLGRRTQIVPAAGLAKLQVYSKAGQLMYESAGGISDRIFCNGFENIACGNTGGTRYVYLGRHLIASDGVSGLTYIHTDGLGSPVAYTNGSGNVTQRRKYEPFGAPVSGAYSDGPGFTGHVMDSATQLSYMQQRYYDPIAARFLSLDPVAASPMSFGRYVYALNSPYAHVDPDGRCLEDACVLEGIAACAAYPPCAAAAAAAIYLTGRAIGHLIQGSDAIPLTPIVHHNESQPPAPPNANGGPSDAPRPEAPAREPEGNTNPYNGPVDAPVIVVDGHGNAIPVATGEQVEGSPNGEFQQVKGANGVPTGVRLDRGGHPRQSDPKARVPHAHRPGVTDETGNPHLPVNPPPPKLPSPA